MELGERIALLVALAAALPLALAEPVAIQPGDRISATVAVDDDGATWSWSVADGPVQTTRAGALRPRACTARGPCSTSPWSWPVARTPRPTPTTPATC